MLAGDGNYVNQIIIAMTSVLANHKGRYVKFHLFIDEFSDEDERRLMECGTCGNSSVQIYRMANYLHHFVTINPKESHNPHVSMASNYRLIMTEVLPDDVEKCIYMDSDMVVDADLSEIYDSMLESELAMVVAEIHSMEYRESVLSRLNDWTEFAPFQKDPLRFPYFNAGFFIINLKMAREKRLFDSIKEFISKHDYIPYTDQDILNAVIGQERPGDVRLLPPHYDVFWNTDHYVTYVRSCYSPEEIRDSFEHPKVVHFCGPWKPWDCGGWPH